MCYFISISDDAKSVVNMSNCHTIFTEGHFGEFVESMSIDVSDTSVAIDIPVSGMFKGFSFENTNMTAIQCDSKDYSDISDDDFDYYTTTVQIPEENLTREDSDDCKFCVCC